MSKSDLDLVAEKERVESAYRNRSRVGPSESKYFGYQDARHLMRVQERHRMTLKLLDEFGLRRLEELRILDVGCGEGPLLRQFLLWGANADNLAGLELRSDAVERARQTLPNVDLRIGSAAQLPWEQGRFDIVCQHTMFTSILDAKIKQSVAAEMTRVLSPAGIILWYDFMYDNPRNPDVKGVNKHEIHALFPDHQITLRRITLAPPISRKIPIRLLSVLYPLLASLAPLRTHYLGIFQPQTPTS